MKVRWNFPLRGGVGLKGVGNEKICGGNLIGPGFISSVEPGFVEEAESCEQLLSHSRKAERSKKGGCKGTFKETISIRLR